jgi:hypothetical protein
MPAPALPDPRRHHDVFISYAQEDKPVADAVCAKLEAGKIRCWIAPRDVPPGKDFPEAIIEGIEGGMIVVVIFSSHANSSPHVIRELTNAVNKGRIIIPFRIEDVVPSKSMEYLISVPHWLDAVTPPLEKHIAVLVQTIDCIIGTDKTPAACIIQGKGPASPDPVGNGAAGDMAPERVCSACHAPLAEGVRFCETCGAPDPKSRTLPEGDPDAEATEPRSAVPEDPPPATSADVVSAPVSSSPVSTGKASGFFLIAGIIIAMLVLAVIGFQTGLISLPGGQPGTSMQDPAAGTTQQVPHDDTYYRSSEAAVGSIHLTTEPTQTLAKDTELYIAASKDMSTAGVTVQFNGGPGIGLVRDNRVILSRSDGTVTEGKLNFKERLSSLKLQGTRGTDRLQVIVTLHSGDTRAIVDMLLPYRQYH